MIRLFLVLTLAATAFAADLVIVVNVSVTATAISADELKLVFLGTKSKLADGSAVEPVLAQSGAAHDEFLKTYLGKSDPALRNYYKSLVFTGKGSMPKSFASDAEIAAFVAKTKGAIGYLPASAPAPGVKRLIVK